MSDTEHGINEGPGTLHIPEVGKHLLLQVGPCFAMLHFVDDGPVGSGPLGHPKQGCGCVGVGRFVGPSHGVSHPVNTGEPVDDGQGVLVGFGMENRNFLLVDLHTGFCAAAATGATGIPPPEVP